MAHQQPGGIITEKGVGVSMNDPGWFDWSYTGVNFDLAGNGGDECQLFIPVWQRIFESVVTTIMLNNFNHKVLYASSTSYTVPSL
jgi:hypothetical protein